MLNPRLALGTTGVLAFAAGAYLSSGPPVLTLLNDSLRISYPWPRAAAALVAAAGAAVVARSIPRRWLQLCGGVLALLAVASATHLLAYRVEAGDGAIEATGLLSRERLAWSDVSRVEAGPGVLVLFEGTQVRVRVDTVDYSADQRASLERTITRRVREAAGGRALPAGRLR
jgi:hypothetical protein